MNKYGFNKRTDEPRVTTKQIMKDFVMNKKLNLEQKSSSLFITPNTLSQEHLEVIIKKIKSANNLEELWRIFKCIKSLNFNFKSEKLAQNYMFVLGGIFVILWVIWMFSIFNMRLSRGSFKAMLYYFFSFFSIMLVGILYSWRIFKRVSHTQQISNSIILKKVALDNKLVFDKVDKKELIQFFEVTFFAFQQGNYSREITRYIKGRYKNKFDYHYFNLHYIDEHTSTSKDANGNKSTSTSYNHYDLYGLIIPFYKKIFIKISNSKTPLKFRKFIKWKTASIYFNKKFKVYTDNEQAVALFLQPIVIERIEELYKIFPEIDIEISPQGLLALSTPDQQLLNCSRQYGVDQLDLFKNEVKQVLDQTKLHKALEFISFLKNYHQQV